MVDQKKSIHITIDSDGSVKMDVQGALGAECTDLTAPFEAAIGNVSKRDFKSEYYASEQETEITQERK